MRKKRAFTLVEMLGVIVIMAAVAIITTPVILGLIEDARREAFKDSVLEMLNTARIYLATHTELIDKMAFECDGEKCIAQDQRLLFNGEVPISGHIVIEGAVITAEYVSNGKYCAYGTMETLQVAEGCNIFDESPPLLNEEKLHLSSTSDKIIIHLEEDFATDPESGILKYQYMALLDGKIVAEQETLKTDIVFTHLSSNTLYEIKVIVFNRATNSSFLQKEISTKPIINPIVEQIDQDPLNTEYATRRTIQMTYSGQNIDNPTYYFKTTTSVTMDAGNIVEQCGNDTMPSTCETYQGSLEVGTWYRINQPQAILTYRAEGTLYTMTSDGTNYVGGSTYTVANIDIGIPSVVPIAPKVRYITGETQPIESQFTIESNGPLPLVTTCRENETVITNLKELAIGTHTIRCEAVKSSEVKTTGSIEIEIVSRQCSSDTIGEIIGGYICSAPDPNCFTCPEGKSKVQLKDGTYTCK